MCLQSWVLALLLAGRPCDLDQVTFFCKIEVTCFIESKKILIMKCAFILFYIPLREKIECGQS